MDDFKILNVNVIGVYENLPMRAMVDMKIFDEGEKDLVATVVAFADRPLQFILHAVGKVYEPSEEKRKLIETSILEAMESYLKKKKRTQSA